MWVALSPACRSWGRAKAKRVRRSQPEVAGPMEPIEPTEPKPETSERSLMG